MKYFGLLMLGVLGFGLTGSTLGCSRKAPAPEASVDTSSASNATSTATEQVTTSPSFADDAGYVKLGDRNIRIIGTAHPAISNRKRAH